MKQIHLSSRQLRKRTSLIKSALIAKVIGQDGPYLTQWFLAHDNRVYGSYRRKANQDFWRLKQLAIFELENLRLVD